MTDTDTLADLVAEYRWERRAARSPAFRAACAAFWASIAHHDGIGRERRAAARRRGATWGAAIMKPCVRPRSAPLAVVALALLCLTGCDYDPPSTSTATTHCTDDLVTVPGMTPGTTCRTTWR